MGKKAQIAASEEVKGGELHEEGERKESQEHEEQKAESQPTVPEMIRLNSQLERIPKGEQITEDERRVFQRAQYLVNEARGKLDDDFLYRTLSLIQRSEMEAERRLRIKAERFAKEQAEKQARDQERARIRKEQEARQHRLSLMRAKEEQAERIRAAAEAKRSSAVREATIQRGVCDLVHFTRIKNLENIQRYGLISRDEADRRRIEQICNDSLRLDRKLDHISVSISWPNSPLFWKFRNDSCLADRCWCILVLEPRLLWELPCLFCAENAASAVESRAYEKDKSSVDAFEQMFDDTGAERVDLNRQQLELPDNFTTNPQAEVLVKQQIPFQYVKQIEVYNEDGKDYAMQHLQHDGDKLITVGKDRFLKRRDWKHWTDARNQMQTRPPQMDRDVSATTLDFDDIPF